MNIKDILLQPRKRSWKIILFGALILVATLYTVTGSGSNADFSAANREIILRKIGHELLLHAGDSTSRVLPVLKTGKDAYQLRFEKAFAFETDSLVDIVDRLMVNAGLEGDYIVNVMNCSASEVMYGFTLSANMNRKTIPCTGRIQPKGCYVVEFLMQPGNMVSIDKKYLLGGISLFALIGLWAFSPVGIRKRTTVSGKQGSDITMIGNTICHFNSRYIEIAGKRTTLTLKENQVLRMLSASPNTIIERGRIQKEIWEDEGVIVGRSLDVFVSRIRKKMEPDPLIQIVNIHGKGYRLEVLEKGSTI